MMDRRSELYLLLGAWLSFVSIVMAGTVFLPPPPTESNQALLYRFATNNITQKPQEEITGKRILADLDAMSVTLFDDVNEPRVFPILSKGREGTFWETPTGKYEVGERSERHFSSIGGTWMPYSLQFYGNFYIHGWPTYPDGTPVAKGYSGGCIRLATEDAREVFDFADPHTPIFVTGGTSQRQFATSSRYYLRTQDASSSATLPDVVATSFLVADVDSGDILWERAQDMSVPAGPSVSLLTALTALETVNQYKMVSMGDLLLGKSVLRNSSNGAADELSVGALIYPLLFDANDTAATAFAREHGVRSFVRSMNQKSLAIGMASSSFSSALSAAYATTTAHDLLLLISYVNAHKHFLIDVTLADERTFTSADGVTEFHWENKNPWLISRDARYRGGVGHLREDGSGSAVILFSLPLSEWSDRTVAFVVPESPDVMGDIERLRSFVQEHYVYGIERNEASLIREKEEPTPSLLQKVKNILDLDRLLQKESNYQREV